VHAAEISLPVFHPGCNTTSCVYVCCRAAGDCETEAELLLQQARLEALADRPEAAIDLLQAAQTLGGSLVMWRDSVALYATVRGGMRSGGARDAVEALEGGLAMMAALAR
jgi:hypothetical protein